MALEAIVLAAAAFTLGVAYAVHPMTRPVVRSEADARALAWTLFACAFVFVAGTIIGRYVTHG